MSYVMRRAAMVLAAASAAAWLSGTVGAQQGAGTRNLEAAKIQNPVRSTPESIAAGKKTYDSYCVGCHAPDGKGGLVLSITEDKGLPPPATLSDTEWDHGGTDGEIYAVIRDGVPPDYIMGPWKDRLQEQDIWNLVNYLKSLSVQK